MKVILLLMINVINVYSVAGIMKNTLPILRPLIFNNMLLVVFKSGQSQEQNNKKVYDFTRDNSKDIEQ